MGTGPAGAFSPCPPAPLLSGRLLLFVSLKLPFSRTGSELPSASAAGCDANHLQAQTGLFPHPSHPLPGNGRNGHVLYRIYCTSRLKWLYRLIFPYSPPPPWRFPQFWPIKGDLLLAKWFPVDPHLTNPPHWVTTCYYFLFSGPGSCALKLVRDG